MINHVIRANIENALSEIHTSFPAKVIRYDEKTQQADFQPIIKRKFHDDSSLKMPEIYNVPVIFPSGGGGLLSFPVNIGDTMLITCSERSIDGWLSSNSDDHIDPHDTRKFNISDSVAIPGLYPFQKSPSLQLTDEDKGNVTLTFKKGKISLKEDNTIAITSDTKLTLNCGETNILISKDSIEIKSGSTLNISTEKAEISASLTTFKGDIDCAGDIKCLNLAASMEVKAMAKTLPVSLSTHVHLLTNDKTSTVFPTPGT